jgi:predicted dehydrogenase
MDPCNVRLRKAILAGKMGRLIGVHAGLPWLRLDSYYCDPHGTWRGTWKLDGGGSLMNQGIHTVDLVQWLAGPVRSVSAFYGVHNHAIEAEDQVVAVLKFENGALGTLYTTTCAVPEGAQRVYMFGTKGSFSRHGDKLEFYEMGPASERKRMMAAFGGVQTADAASRDPLAVSADGHTLIIEDLVQAVRRDRSPVIPIESAAHSVAIAAAIYQSGRTGREVRVRGIGR